MTVSPPILVVLGPTASGKSAVAMAVAEAVGGEILSVDSMQVYRGMDVGTAKPTADERARVRHHLLDVVGPDEPFAVARFVELADAVIADAVARNVPLIATGGTPLYYKALFEGLFEGPGADEAVRARLGALPTPELYEKVKAVDPAAAGRIDSNDHRRLVRALEVYELTGQPISSFQTHWTQPEPRHAGRWVGLMWDKDALNRRVNARTKAMLAGGWVDEVRALMTDGPLSQTAMGATGYKELIDVVNGKTSLADAAEQIKIATRQLARKQMKWFRRFPNVAWVEGDRPTEQIAADVVRSWLTTA